jgi:hypothetical protein
MDTTLMYRISLEIIMETKAIKMKSAYAKLSQAILTSYLKRPCLLLATLALPRSLCMHRSLRNFNYLVRRININTNSVSLNLPQTTDEPYNTQRNS